MIDDERGDVDAEEAAAECLADADEVGEIGVGVAQFAGDDRSEVRMLFGSAHAAAGVQVVGATSMSGFLADDRTDDGDVAERLGQFRPMFGNRDAGQSRLDGLRRTTVLGARLGVPGLHLAGGSGQPDQDAGSLLLLELFGAESQGGQERGDRESQGLAS